MMAMLKLITSLQVSFVHISLSASDRAITFKLLVCFINGGSVPLAIHELLDGPL